MVATMGPHDEVLALRPPRRRRPARRGRGGCGARASARSLALAGSLSAPLATTVAARPRALHAVADASPFAAGGEVAAPAAGQAELVEVIDQARIAARSRAEVAQMSGQGLAGGQDPRAIVGKPDRPVQQGAGEAAAGPVSTVAARESYDRIRGPARSSRALDVGGGRVSTACRLRRMALSGAPARSSTRSAGVRGRCSARRRGHQPEPRDAVEPEQRAAVDAGIEPCAHTRRKDSAATLWIGHQTRATKRRPDKAAVTPASSPA